LPEGLYHPWRGETGQGSVRWVVIAEDGETLCVGAAGLFLWSYTGNRVSTRY
jgi:hypothetical protein